MRRPEKVDIIRKVIRRVAPDAEVILYGSEARGDAREDSDFDILILTPSKLNLKGRREITYPLYDLMWQNNILVSPLLFAKSDWYNRPIVNDFYANVMTEGIRL